MNLYESRECFKDLNKKCPHHDLPIWLQIPTFYNFLGATNRSMIDATSSGALMSKTSEVAYDF